MLNAVWEGGTGPFSDRDDECVGAAIEALPRQVGPYLLLERIGEGGMGVVYRARQSHPEREVAIKMVRSIGGTGKQSRRFAREISILARLMHAGIAQIYDAGTDFSEGSARPYLVMELIHGRPLRSFITDDRFSLRDRLQLMIQVCDAVEYAHNQGVIHRDLKPENIIVERTADDLRARILDFGVARLVDSETPGVTTSTHAGHILGTLGYMSSEMLDGAVDAGVDVYALGVLLYELITRELPIRTGGKAIAEALSDIREMSPSRPSQINSAAGGDLDTIVMTAIDRDLKRRYASPARLGDDLRRLLEDRPILAREPSLVYVVGKFARRRRGLVAAVGVVMLALLCGGAMGWYGLYRANLAMDQLVDNFAFMAERMLKSLDAIAGTSAVRADALDRLEVQVKESLASRPGDARLQGILAETLLQRGNMIRDEGRNAEALPYRLRTVEIREELARRSPNDIEIQGRLAIDYVLVGDLHHDDPTLEVSRDYYERALRIHESLVEAHPERLDWVDDLGWSCHRLAWLAYRTARYTDSQLSLDRQFEICRRMAASAPEDPRTDSQFQAAHSFSASLAGRLGDEARRVREGREAFVFSKKMFKHDPDRTLYMQQYLASGLNCADSEIVQGDANAAESLLEEIGPVCASMERREPGKPFSHIAAIHLLMIRQQIAELRQDQSKADALTSAILDRVRSVRRNFAQCDEFDAPFQQATELAKTIAVRAGDVNRVKELTREQHELIRERGLRSDATAENLLSLAICVLEENTESSQARAEAIRIGRKALELDQVGEPTFLRAMALLMTRCGELDAARQCFGRAIATFPEDAPARLAYEREMNQLESEFAQAEGAPRD